MNVHVPAQDERAIEVLASGLPLHHGAQFAGGHHPQKRPACPNASQVSSAVLTRAREDKEAKYHELLSSEKCRLVVVALVAGGAANRSSSSRHWLVPELGTVLRRCVDPLSTFGFEGGSGCCQCSPRGSMRPRWSLPGQRLLTGKTGLRPIWSSCFQVDLSECRVSFLCQQLCFQQMIVFSPVPVAKKKKKKLSAAQKKCLSSPMTPCAAVGEAQHGAEDKPHKKEKTSRERNIWASVHVTGVPWVMTHWCTLHCST